MMFTLTSFSRLLTIAFAFCVLAAQPVAAQEESAPPLGAQLLVAAKAADIEGIKKSLDRGALPNSRNRLGKTTLYLAVEKNRLDIAKLMLKAGADVNLASLEKVTPLIAASYAGADQMVDLLLAHGAKLEEEDRLHKSALVYAAGMGHTAIVEKLLTAGAKIDAAYIDGLTPLMWAAGQGHTAAVKVLLDKGANKNLKDDRGLTALEMAKEGKHAAIVSLLK